MVNTKASRVLIVFVILSVCLILSQVTGIIYASSQLNFTGSDSNQTMIQQQSNTTQLKPFTIPSVDQSEGDLTQATVGNLGTTTSANNQGSNNDLVLLSQRYNNERFGDEIVGEILNNGSITVEYAKVSVSFLVENPQKYYGISEIISKVTETGQVKHK